MRVYILRALLAKEFRRHLANRGGIALGLLLIAAAGLLSVFNPGGADAAGTGMVGGVHHCYVEFAGPLPLVDHLRANLPAELKQQVVFREWSPGRVDGLVTYPPGIGAIQIRQDRDPATDRPRLTFAVWHPQGDPQAMTHYEAWFWKESLRAMYTEAAKTGAAAGLTPPEYGADDLWAVRDCFRRLAEQTGGGAGLPVVQIERQGLGGKVLDVRSAIATGMVVFALYFACVYLLPTLNCEERERGVLLAQALSPASPAEILMAKFLFYPVLGGGLAAVLAAIYKPTVVWSVFFWLSLSTVAAGFLGIGMTVATLAKTQRAAFMGAMCYLLAVALVILICSTNGIYFLPLLAFEYHVPRILHAALSDDIPKPTHWLHLLAAGGLAAGWLTAAGWLFRRRGWQ